MGKRILYQIFCSKLQDRHFFTLRDIHISYKFVRPRNPGYTFESKCRLSRIGGGVGAYIKNEVPYTRREDLEKDGLELIWLEIAFKNCRSFIIGVLYRPLTAHKHFTKSLRDVLNIITLENKETILLGDINCDYLKDNDHRDIKDLFITQGYKQLFNKATRITESSETLIDVI